MKRFIYFEEQEGGMEPHHVSFAEGEKIELPIIGWMKFDCVQEDSELIDWIKRAEIGEYYYHRMGVIVCIKPDA